MQTVETKRENSSKKGGKVICCECGTEMGHMKILLGIIQGLCDSCKKALMDRSTGNRTTPDFPNEDEASEDEGFVRKLILFRVIEGGKGKENRILKAKE